MPAGFQAFGAGGEEVFSLSDQIPRVFGSVSTTPNQAGFVDHDGFASGRPMAFPMANAVGVNNRNAMSYPQVSFNGNRMDWTAATESVIIAYGVK